MWRQGRVICCFFFFQAEDGIRDLTVTGVQTCALPIWCRPARVSAGSPRAAAPAAAIGRRLRSLPRSGPAAGRASSGSVVAHWFHLDTCVPEATAVQYFLVRGGSAPSDSSRTLPCPG